jgi:hypothetical protein
MTSTPGHSKAKGRVACPKQPQGPQAASTTFKMQGGISPLDKQAPHRCERLEMILNRFPKNASALASARRSTTLPTSPYS